jgi:hypothetical protein
MAMPVSFFAGDSAAILSCLDSGGWPREDTPSACREEAGFKFGVMPEQAFGAFVDSAVPLAAVQPFRFADRVSGMPVQAGESFPRAVNGRFIELFADFPEELIPELAAPWTISLDRLYELEYPS